MKQSINISSSFTLPLWPDGIPNKKGESKTETPKIKEPGLTFIENVHTPEIEIFLPSAGNSSGKAVIICPGGGYEGVAYDWEGTDIAKMMNSKGVAGIVLKYRLPDSDVFSDSHVVPLQDAQRALRITRYRAKEWNIDPDKIGIMGFSAGGHIASTLAKRFDEETVKDIAPIDLISARPDFLILIYPVISMYDPVTHKGSRDALLSKDADQNLLKRYSNEIDVNIKTPPAFIVHSADDDTVPVENSISFFTALKNKGIPVEMHIFPYGGHGYSLAINKGSHSTWPQRLFEWMEKEVK